MKDLGKTKYCLGLQIEHKSNGILIHQSTYVEKVFKQFNMDKTHPLNSPMIVRSFDVKKYHFFFQKKKMKHYLVLKYHILVQLVLCYT